MKYIHLTDEAQRTLNFTLREHAVASQRYQYAVKRLSEDVTDVLDSSDEVHTPNLAEYLMPSTLVRNAEEVVRYRAAIDSLRMVIDWYGVDEYDLADLMAQAELGYEITAPEDCE